MATFISPGMPPDLVGRAGANPQHGWRDGVGDLPGIISRLDDVPWPGIEAIWLNPINPSPPADFGDDVDPIFGSLADLDRLVSEAQARGGDRN